MAVTRDNPSPESVNELPSFIGVLALASERKPLDLQSFILFLEGILLKLLGVLAPLDGTSLFYPVLSANNLSSLRILYDGYTVSFVFDFRLCF